MNSESKNNSSNNKNTPQNQGKNTNNKKKPYKGKKFSGSNAKRGGSGKKHHSKRNNHTGKLTSINAIFTKYDNLFEQYLRSRAKYFEMFFRAKGKQMDKIDRNYTQALNDFVNFPKKLTEYQLEKLKQRRFRKEDLSYSQSHNLSELGSVTLTDNDPDDPHINDDQKDRPSFIEDTEESVGSMDDYKKLKGEL